MDGTIHIYHPKRGLLLFEHKPAPTASSTPAGQSNPPQNTLLFIGGMYDNFLDPVYTAPLSALFPRHSQQQWSFIHVQLSSAGRSFGVSDLNKDIDEISVAIKYVRKHLRPSTSGNIVLLGHSTGCQDVLHYLYSPNKSSRPPVQGAILQAPVSDRDPLLEEIQMSSESRSKYDKALAITKSTPVEEHRSVILPTTLTYPFFGPAPLCIARYLSLASPESPASPSLDDLFSNDATDTWLKSTFGNIASNGLLKPSTKETKPSLLVLMSDGDAAVPAHVNKLELLGRWRKAMDGTGAEMDSDSHSIPSGGHGLKGDNASNARARLVEFRGRVLRYLDRVVGGVDDESWRIFREDEEKVIQLEKTEAQRTGIEKDVGDLKL